MTQKVLRDVAASARQRLLNLARATERSFQLVLNRYAVERLLFRLSSSRYREQFVVKGATLFALWSEAIARPTRDLDLLGLREKDSEEVRAIFQELCRLAVPDDGLVFTADSVRVEPLRAGTDFEGLRVLLQATLAGARIPLQVDIGFGDAVTPPALESEFPAILKFPAPRVLTYRRETVIAEKFDAMHKLGMANSRMKDFFDIWFLANRFPFAGTVLSAALRAAYERRKARLTEETPVALTPAFFEDASKAGQWRVFLRMGGLETTTPPLADVCSLLGEFLTPPHRAAVRGKSFPGNWPAGGPWSEAGP